MLVIFIEIFDWGIAGMMALVAINIFIFRIYRLALSRSCGLRQDSAKSVKTTPNA
jgi:hypothetical protein